MNYSNVSVLRSVLNRAAPVALALSLALAFFPIPAAKAAEAAAMRPLDDQLQPVPLTPSVDKADGENGPYVLSLKNSSGDSIRASGTVQLSVASHGDKKTRDIPEHVVGRAEVWAISGLAAGDKVTIMAQGFAPLVVAIP